MRTPEAQKLDVSVGRRRKSWTCPYVFNGLMGVTNNSLLSCIGVEIQV